MRDSISFKLGSVEIDSIKLNNIECTYTLEGTKEEYNELVDKLLTFTTQVMDKLNNINSNKEAK